jgi:hypothetical protein
MAAIKYVIELTDDEREQLIEITRRGSSPARKLKRAMILLKANESLGDSEIARMVDVGIATVGRIRQRFVAEGLEMALRERPPVGDPPRSEASSKPISSPWLAANHQKDMSAGACACWLGRWLN